MPEALLCHTQLTAMDFLERCVRDFEPLAALTGEAGTGKTTVLDAALARLDRAGDRIIRARNFPAGPLSLHRALTAALGVPGARALPANRLEAALRRALADAGHATPPVLAVDNAHALPPETLRYLSLLAGLREAGRPLFRILLVGRSGFATREAIPVQQTLEPVHPEAARRVVEQRLAATGVVLDDDAVRSIVQDARGNLGRIDALVRAEAERVEAARGGPLWVVGARIGQKAGQLLSGGGQRWRDTLALSGAFILLSMVAGVLAYKHEAPSRRTVGVASARAGASVAAPLAAPIPAPPPRPTTVAAASPVPAQPVQPKAVLTAAVPAAPVRDVSASQPPAVAAAPSPPVAAPPPLPDPPAAQAVAPASDVASAVAALLAPRPRPWRFRVNNVSSCHHGVCPRWSVTDIERQAHFFAAFDPTPLHLDHDTLQRLRQGTLELTVSGSVKKRGSDGQTLVADAVQSMAPHRVKPRAAADTGDAASSLDRSPPPGFLPVPNDGQPPEDSRPPENAPPAAPVDPEP